MMRGMLRLAGAMGTLIVGLGAVGCTGEPADDRADPGPPPVGAPGIELVAYDSCAAALREFKRTALARVGPYGLPGGFRSGVMLDGARVAAEATSQSAAPEHSTTNVHEPGVDELDVVKTDGKRLVTVVGRKLRVVDVATRRLTDSIDIGSHYATGLFLHGDRALVLAPADYAEPGILRDSISGLYVPEMRLVSVDLAAGRVDGELTVDGNMVDARSVDGIARVVVRSGPRMAFDHPAGLRSEAEATARHRKMIRRSTIADWLPRYALRSGVVERTGRLVDCSRISHPEPATGVSMLTVLTFDVGADLGTGDPVSITGEGGTVYGTAESLYVADDNVDFGMPVPMEDGTAPEQKQQRTTVYQFDTSGRGAPRFVASGAVDGSLLNQYSLSEYDGYLRVATTEQGWSSSGAQMRSQSAVTVLQRQGDRLVRVGGVGGLGKGEQIYAVRFLGDTGYVVTFRQVDPLYRIDLSDPRQPRLAGELKITGYSAYLHPVGDGRLLGVGQEATTDGRTTGTQVSLFAVDGPPRRLAQHRISGAHSEAEWDPHAFLYWPQRSVVVLPIMQWDIYRADDGPRVLVLRIDGDRLTEVGTVTHPHKGDMVREIRRSVVIGDVLWTVSDAGVRANDIDGLAGLGWVPFA